MVTTKRDLFFLTIHRKSNVLDLSILITFNHGRAQRTQVRQIELLIRQTHRIIIKPLKRDIGRERRLPIILGIGCAKHIREEP